MSYDIKKATEGLTIVERVGASTTFRIAVKTKGSPMTYDRSACHVVKTPH